MKKGWLWVLAIVVIAAVVGIWLWRPNVVPAVETMILTPTQVEHTVSCNGVVEAADGVGVFVPITCRVREVNVSVGQRVQKGDVLAVIDKEQTMSDTTDVTSQLALAALREEIVAPEEGIIVELAAEAGKTLKQGTPCALIVRGCDMRVRIAIREKDLRVLREGMAVRISGDGLEKASYSGVLSEIACTATTGSSATMVAGVVFPNIGEIDDSFRLGLTAKAAVVTSVTETGYLVPYEAVLADDVGSYFYLLNDGVAQRYRVEDAVQMARGWLLTDETLAQAVLIMEPEKVAGDGAVIAEAVS